MAQEPINDTPTPVGEDKPVEEANKPVLEAINDTPTELSDQGDRLEEEKSSEGRTQINESE